jgi:hypothetical protein
MWKIGKAEEHDSDTEYRCVSCIHSWALYVTPGQQCQETVRTKLTSHLSWMWGQVPGLEILQNRMRRCGFCSYEAKTCLEKSMTNAYVHLLICTRFTEQYVSAEMSPDGSHTCIRHCVEHQNILNAEIGHVTYWNIPTYLPTHPPTHPSIHPSIHPSSTYLRTHPSTYLIEWLNS